MAEQIVFLASQTSLWLQPDGPNTPPVYLGCHEVGDIAEPQGDTTLQYCPDPSATGKFVVKNSFSGTPGAVTTTVTTDLRKVADYMESVGKCPTTLFIHKVACGRPDTFTNYDRTFILRKAVLTNRTLSKISARTPANEDESIQTFDLSAQALDRVFVMQANRSAITETEDITGITICGEDRCESGCGSSQKQQDYMFAAAKALVGSAGSKAHVLASLKGASWGDVAADPFAVGKDIQGIVCFKMGKNTIRVLVAIGTTSAGVPVVAYSDDLGSTWTTATVGSVNADFVKNGHALFALDRYHIWLGTNGGRIYFSADGGVTWTLQENAAISATAITGVSFVDPNIGFACYTGGQVGKTTDGGTTWAAATVSGSAAALDIDAISAYAVWVVGSDGMFYTTDAGVTWSKRNANAVAALDFLNESVGYAVGSSISGSIWQTIDGGYDWSALTSMANQGFYDVVALKADLAYATGKASGGTGTIVKIQPEP